MRLVLMRKTPFQYKMPSAECSDHQIQLPDEENGVNHQSLWTISMERLLQSRRSEWILGDSTG